MAQPSADLIRGIPIFADLDDASVKQLAGDFIEREFSAGQSIATEGEGGLNFFVVESGSADVSVGGTPSPPRAGRLVRRDRARRQVGPLGDRHRDIAAAGVRPAVWSFRSFAESRPSVTWKLLELLAERLRAAEHR